MSMFWTRRDKTIRQVAIAGSFVHKLKSRRAASTDREIVPFVDHLVYATTDRVHAETMSLNQTSRQRAIPGAI